MLLYGRVRWACPGGRGRLMRGPRDEKMGLQESGRVFLWTLTTFFHPMSFFSENDFFELPPYFTQIIKL
jgi:hypothetical protein